MKSRFRPYLVAFLIQCLIFAAPSGAIAIPVQGQRILVAGPSPYSVEITREITKKGGNVVDAAVAVALGLAVTTPYYAALGGGGFALIRLNGKPVEALDFREVAPQASGPEFYKGKAKNSSIDGGAAVAVPGMTAGLWEMHKKYGKLRWKDLVLPAVRLARHGFMVSGEWYAVTKKSKARFTPGGQKAFFKKSGGLYLPGDTLKQQGLANALDLLASQGPKAFYEGPIGKDIVNAVSAANGVMTEKDLKAYKPRWLKPLQTEFADHTIYLMPPPSSGGVVITSALQMMQALKLKNRPPLSVDELHLLAEVLKIAFRGRSLLGDPAFHANPIERLLSPQALKDMAKRTKLDSTLKLELIKESEQTTHLSLLDNGGNAVAMTVTLNGNYGSGVVSERYGIALNNEMDDFTTRPGEPNMFGLVQGRANRIEPGKRPLSSMSPTLVEKDGRIVLSLGSPGGPRIISSVLQVLYRVLANGMDIDRAIQTPRVHHQFLPDVLYVDAQRLSPDVITLLNKRGHTVEESGIARVYGVRSNDDGLLEAAYDSRGEGGAGGL